jgi:hypothetical protein
MIPPAQSWDTERTVALLALNNHSNGTDSDMTSVRITTAVSKMIDLSLYNDGVPWLTLRTGPRYRTFRMLPISEAARGVDYSSRKSRFAMDRSGLQI